MSGLVDTTEMYLKSIYELVEDGVTPLRARIVDRLGHSGPTVSQTIARMERDGLVTVEGDRKITLTSTGLRSATEVIRKHRLAERLLTDVIGLDWIDAHEEACRWEHVMSEKVETLLLPLLKEPAEDPYGNPIPDVEQTAIALAGGMSIEHYYQQYSAGGSAVLYRVGEPLQAQAGLLQELAAAKLLPGSQVTLSFGETGSEVRITGVLAGQSEGNAAKEVVLGDEGFKHFFVRLS